MHERYFLIAWFHDSTLNKGNIVRANFFKEKRLRRIRRWNLLSDPYHNHKPGSGASSTQRLMRHAVLYIVLRKQLTVKETQANKISPAQMTTKKTINLPVPL